MNALPRLFIPEKSAGIDAVTWFSLSGENGGNWTVSIRNQIISVTPNEPAEKPTLTLLADAQDILDIFSGKLDATRAYMQGKLQVKGNFGLAFKLSNLFRLDDGIFRSVR
jgi:putative sterol carrier protein